MGIKSDTQYNINVVLLSLLNVEDRQPHGYLLNVSQPPESLKSGLKIKFSNVQTFASPIFDVPLGSHLHKLEGFLFWENSGSQTRFPLLCNSWFWDQRGSTTKVSLIFLRRENRFKFSPGLCCVGRTSRAPGISGGFSMFMESTTSPGSQSGSLADVKIVIGGWYGDK